jgi:hypothetical protein
MLKRILIPVLAGLAVLPLEAGAWIGYHGGGFVRGPEGGVAAWHRGGWGGAAVVHPYAGPVYRGGCWGCVGGAAAVGLAAGAAIGAAASSPAVVVQQPVYVSTPSVGSTVVSLPGGCKEATVGGTRYYGCAGTYYRPHFGANGVYYTVVPNPF